MRISIEFCDEKNIYDSGGKDVHTLGCNSVTVLTSIKLYYIFLCNNQIQITRFFLIYSNEENPIQIFSFFFTILNVKKLHFYPNLLLSFLGHHHILQLAYYITSHIAEQIWDIQLVFYHDILLSVVGCFGNQHIV